MHCFLYHETESKQKLLRVFHSFILQKHRAQHRNDEAKFRCDICNFDPKNADALAEHKKMHVGLSPLQCVVCKKIFSHKRNIRPHMRLHVSLLAFRPSFQCTFDIHA